MYAQTLHFEDDALQQVLEDADHTLQRLLRNMILKKSMAGTLTIRLDIELMPQLIENHDPAVAGDTRKALIPQLTHKVNSVMQLKDEIKGVNRYSDYELVLDEGRGEYVLKPIATAQQSIFDGDYQSGESGYSTGNRAAGDTALPSEQDENGGPEDMSEVFAGASDDPSEQWGV